MSTLLFKNSLKTFVKSILLIYLLPIFYFFDYKANADETSNPFPGVTWEHITSIPNQNVNILIVDLCSPGIAVRATDYSERGRTTPNWASGIGLQAAINGDFCVLCGPAWHHPDYSPAGLAMSAATGTPVQWPGTADTPFEGFIAAGFGRIMLSPNTDVLPAPEPWMREIVGGRPTILQNGTVRTSWPENESLQSLCTERDPRTAIGLSQDHRTLIMLVADGRTHGWAGMTCPEVANILLSKGAWDGLNMDGGGSSTMWIQGRGVVNYPSDGSLRTLTNHLGIYATGAGYDWSHCPYYAAQFVDQSFPYAHIEPLYMTVGESVDGWIELRNAGRATWDPNVTKLAPTPRDIGSPFYDRSWLSSIRISTVSSTIPPQATFRFPVRLTASRSGDFFQTFGLVQEGVTWFADPPLGGGPPDNFLGVHIIVNEPPLPDPPPDILEPVPEPRPDATSDSIETITPPDAYSYADRTESCITDGTLRETIRDENETEFQAEESTQGCGCNMVK